MRTIPLSIHSLIAVAMLIGGRCWASEPVVLPGSTLSIAQAKRDARYIVVAEVVKTGPGHSRVGFSYLSWTELKPSSVLKGEVDEQELNSMPLSIMGQRDERLPKIGEEYTFFVGPVSHFPFAMQPMPNRPETPDEIGFTEARSCSGEHIIKISKKTSDNLAAIEKAGPDLFPKRAFHAGGGLGGGGLGGGGLASGGLGGGGLGGGGLGGNQSSGIQLSKIVSRRGLPFTNVFPNPTSRGETLRIQTEFAAVLSEVESIPADRDAHFAWLYRNECYRRYRAGSQVWFATITNSKPRPGGGWTLRVSLSPRLSSMGVRGLILDSVEETYEFVDGKIRLLESNATTPKPALQIFPVSTADIVKLSYAPMQRIEAPGLAIPSSTRQ